MPSSDATVTGYHVYVRDVGSEYGAPIDAGNPTAKADGSMNVAVNGLDDRADHTFTMTSYNASGVESVRSNEMQLDSTGGGGTGTPGGTGPGSACANNPLECDDGDACTVDTCSPTLGCVHTVIVACAACATSRDCNDGNPCTTDSCVNHQCVSANNTFVCSDDGNPCTLDVCSGGACTHPPRPDGTACDTSDACTTTRQCSAGACVTTAEVAPGTDLALVVSGFSVRPGRNDTAHLNARGWLAAPPALAPDRDGVTVEIDDAEGNAVYSATVPPEAFRPMAGRSRFMYAALSSQAAPFGGLRRLIVANGRDRAKVALVAVLPTPDAAAVSSATLDPTLAWTLRTGGRCATDHLHCRGAQVRRCS
jgi:hypothetical protein